MILEPLNNKKMKIKLSNTESVNQNIYKFATIENEKETKSTSSTCSYFITTNDLIGKEISKIINFDNVFICDVKKTLECAVLQSKLLSKIKNNFKGNLSQFYDSLSKLKLYDSNELTIGLAAMRKDSNQRYNLYFDNDNESVSLFRNSIIAVLCDIVIEPREDYNMIYTEMKSNLNIFENDYDELEKEIIKLSNNLKNISNVEKKEYIKDLIRKMYALLSKLNDSQ